MLKIILIVIDGLGDRLISELSNQTPLQAAQTPNLDLLAREGLCGLLRPCFSGPMPTTEEGLLALLGYDRSPMRLEEVFLPPALPE